MARKKRDYEEEYEEEYEDEEYEDDDYEDDDYDDEPRRRNPLTPFFVAVLILLILAAAIIALLYMRLQASDDRVTELSAALSTTQTELNRVKAEAASATPAPETTPEPEATPEVTPEPTPEPTATPSPLLKDAITDEMLNGVYRPADGDWFEEAKEGYVTSEYMLAVHWGPGMEWLENMVLYRDNKVELLAMRNIWYLLRTEDGRYGWATSALLKEGTPG